MPYRWLALGLEANDTAGKPAGNRVNHFPGKTLETRPIAYLGKKLRSVAS